MSSFWDIETVPDIKGFAAAKQAKATLHELCRVMGLPGKPDGIDGGEVEKYFREGRIREIA
jgi:predicted PolB exonuclease-like 3'-5' exonuclease